MRDSDLIVALGVRLGEMTPAAMLLVATPRPQRKSWCISTPVRTSCIAFTS